MSLDAMSVFSLAVLIAIWVSTVTHYAYKDTLSDHCHWHVKMKVHVDVGWDFFYLPYDADSKSLPFFPFFVLEVI